MMGVLDDVKVGERLYVSNGMTGSLETVVRMTRTLVMTRCRRFYRSDGRLQGAGGLRTVARVATADDVAMVRRQQMVRECNAIRFGSLSDGQLERILEIANEKEE